MPDPREPQLSRPWTDAPWGVDSAGIIRRPISDGRPDDRVLYCSRKLHGSLADKKLTALAPEMAEAILRFVRDWTPCHLCGDGSSCNRCSRLRLCADKLRQIGDTQ